MHTRTQATNAGTKTSPAILCFLWPRSPLKSDFFSHTADLVTNSRLANETLPEAKPPLHAPPGRDQAIRMQSIIHAARNSFNP